MHYHVFISCPRPFIDTVSVPVGRMSMSFPTSLLTTNLYHSLSPVSNIRFCPIPVLVPVLRLCLVPDPVPFKTLSSLCCCPHNPEHPLTCLHPSYCIWQHLCPAMPSTYSCLDPRVSVTLRSHLCSVHVLSLVSSQISPYVVHVSVAPPDPTQPLPLPRHTDVSASTI